MTAMAYMLGQQYAHEKAAAGNLQLYRGTKTPMLPPDDTRYLELLMKHLDDPASVSRKEAAELQQLAKRSRAFFSESKREAQLYAGKTGSLYRADVPASVIPSLHPEYNNLHKPNQLMVWQLPVPAPPGVVVEKIAAGLRQDVTLQPHQQRVADRVSGDDPRLLLYHGLGTGKSLAAIAAAEAVKARQGGGYAVVAPASLRDNFGKEIGKFTSSRPAVLSYTGLGMGKPLPADTRTLILDEAHRVRNPEGQAAIAAQQAAAKAEALILLTGSPIVNSPGDLAPLLSMLKQEQVSPESFEDRYIEYEKVNPGFINRLRGVRPGEIQLLKNRADLKQYLRGHIDYQPSRAPEGVTVNEQVIRVPMSEEQLIVQQALRKRAPPGSVWKLDKDFPLSRTELAKLNSFLTGMRQASLSVRSFSDESDAATAFAHSGKLQSAMAKLRHELDKDPRKKALIYSNFIESGLVPYAAGLDTNKIPHAVFHGGVSEAGRRQAIADYNAGKVRALLLGPAGAEGISTKGTSLIQILDPHWNESRGQQAQGRGLRFDSHNDLPEELKNVLVQRFISKSVEPSRLRSLFGARRERTGDEMLEQLAATKEDINNKFRQVLREVGGETR